MKLLDLAVTNHHVILLTNQGVYISNDLRVKPPTNQSDSLYVDCVIGCDATENNTTQENNTSSQDETGPSIEWTKTYSFNGVNIQVNITK